MIEYMRCSEGWLPLQIGQGRFPREVFFVMKELDLYTYVG